MLFSGKCWCGRDETGLLKNGGLTSDDECDMECSETSGEICGGRERMTVYSIDCYYPDGLDVGAAFTEEGCFVDSRRNRILPDGVEGQEEMSAAVRELAP